MQLTLCVPLRHISIERLLVWRRCRTDLHGDSPCRIAGIFCRTPHPCLIQSVRRTACKTDFHVQLPHRIERSDSPLGQPPSRSPDIHRWGISAPQAVAAVRRQRIPVPACPPFCCRSLCKTSCSPAQAVRNFCKFSPFLHLRFRGSAFSSAARTGR